MPTVVVTHSETHPVRVPVVERQLPDCTIETLQYPPGPLDGGDEEALIDALDGAEALLLRPGTVSRHVFENAPDLRIVAVHGSGYGRVDLDAATEHGVVVTHSPGAPGPAVVEHTFGLIFALLRDLIEVNARTTNGEWNTARRTHTELGECTLGVVGLGTIGFEVATRARDAFGSTVIGYDPYVMGERTSGIYPRVSAREVEDAGIELADLHALLDRADIVTLHVPLMEGTSGLIGADELRRLTDCYLVNTARGGVVDEDALITAVEDERLAGVALDVLSVEPPGSDHPLLRSEDVLVTPHTAGVTGGYLTRAAELGAEKIRTVLDGERPDTTVNPDVFD